MANQELLGQIEDAFGMIPKWVEEMPDAVLEQWWTVIGWVMADGALSARDKALVAFGAATAIHCEY